MKAENLKVVQINIKIKRLLIKLLKYERNINTVK